MQKEMHLSSNLDGASLLICILYAHFRPALAGLFFFHHDLLVYLLLQLGPVKIYAQNCLQARLSEVSRQ